MENKISKKIQELFCPLEQNMQKLGTILSIRPVFDTIVYIKIKKNSPIAIAEIILFDDNNRHLFRNALKYKFLKHWYICQYGFYFYY